MLFRSHLSLLCPPLSQPLLKAATSSLWHHLPEPRLSCSSCFLLFCPRYRVGRPGGAARTLTRLRSWRFGGRGPPSPGVTLEQEGGSRRTGVPIPHPFYLLLGVRPGRTRPVMVSSGPPFAPPFPRPGFPLPPPPGPLPRTATRDTPPAHRPRLGLR